MSLLELKDIGKIYVSEGTVSVGIRGVNLSFDRGEFVAITGQSGSGKSTLLNVISGMDSYEEGELCIEGNQTSHFTQADWEKYREKYISFIFQEYNIIDSFTVLENVELALMHIENPIERRNRALELIKRVGLEEHIKHKGSHLSGGQKQRTVIARALAKDSPIILADEPTGNLDSNTSAEIVELLKEVSRDKLLIVVTHNFEEVEACATREIRVFDGAIASDVIMSAKKNISADGNISDTSTVEHKHSFVKNSLALGFTVFKSKPKLSTFMCLLFTIAGLVLYFAFSMYWQPIKSLFLNTNYIFYNPGGRVVVAKNDGSIFTEAELEKIKQLADEGGAETVLHLDAAYDCYSYDQWVSYYPDYDYYDSMRAPYNFVTGIDYGTLDYGRYPENDYEAVISLPYFINAKYGAASIDNDTIDWNGITYTIVGIHYYYDSDVQGQLLLTDSGFKLASALNYFYKFGTLCMLQEDSNYCGLHYNSSVPVGEYYISEKNASYITSGASFEIARMLYSDNEMTGTGIKVSADKLKIDDGGEYGTISGLTVNIETIKEQLIDYAEQNYRQVSILYSSDSKAVKGAELFVDNGYKTVKPGDTYKVQSYLELISVILVGVMYLIMWIFFIIFTSFFIRICTKKSMDAFKGDIAIMRSMGIRVSEIKAAIYFRIYICIVPALILLPIVSNILIRTDFGGRNMSYLHLFEFSAIFVLLLLVVSRVAKKHVANLFSENVRKALKGDE